MARANEERNNIFFTWIIYFFVIPLSLSLIQTHYPPLIQQKPQLAITSALMWLFLIGQIFTYRINGVMAWVSTLTLCVIIIGSLWKYCLIVPFVFLILNPKNTIITKIFVGLAYLATLNFYFFYVLLIFLLFALPIKIFHYNKYIKPIKNGDMEKIYKLLEDRKNLEKLIGKDNLLSLAVKYNKLDIAEILIKAGANPNLPKRKGKLSYVSDYRPPFIDAIETKNEAMINLFLTNGADINMRFEKGRTIAHEIDNIQALKLLLEKGLDVNIPDDYGRIPAFYLDQDNEFFELLLENTKDINAKDKDGISILSNLVADNISVPIMKILIDRGADVNSRCLKGWTPLHFAVNNDPNKKTIAFLLSKGAQINAKNNDGETPLDLIRSDSSGKHVNLQWKQAKTFLRKNGAKHGKEI